LTRITLGIAAALALAVTLPAVPAKAQSGALTRAFVSSTGLDSNACTITAPCATFAVAYTKVGANGIIAAIDPGKYGPIVITGPVTINGNGWASITGPTTGTATAITITAVSGDVILNGLEIDGTGAARYGIVFNSGSSLAISNCTVQNFIDDGIAVQPGIGTTMLLITDVAVSYNNAGGIQIAPTASASVEGLIKRATLNADAGNAVTVDGGGTTGNVDVTIVDSAALGGPNTNYGNNGQGFLANSASGTANTTMYLDNISANYFGAAVEATNKAVVWIRRSAISRNLFAVNDVNIVSPGAVYSFGDNAFAGNGGNFGGNGGNNGTVTPISNQ
jgi:hypothetical protein